MMLSNCGSLGFERRSLDFLSFLALLRLACLPFLRFLPGLFSLSSDSEEELDVESLELDGGVAGSGGVLVVTIAVDEPRVGWPLTVDAAGAGLLSPPFVLSPVLGSAELEDELELDDELEPDEELELDAELDEPDEELELDAELDEPGPDGGPDEPELDDELDDPVVVLFGLSGSKGGHSRGCSGLRGERSWIG